MCCLFTCCAWVVDAIQRAWVFAMSCCVCTAICTMMIIASVSGVALGYNYSLAEFVELKETNISVFLKRGVFDDTVVDEMDWRRGGGGPPADTRSEPAQRSDYNAPAADDVSMRKSMPISPDDDSYSPPPGKRLDDSIIMADNNRQFEGALMKLTGSAANLVTTLGWDIITETSPPSTPDRDIEFTSQAGLKEAYEHEKKVQGLMNRRKLEMYPTPLHGPSTVQVASKMTETMYTSTHALPFQPRRMDINADAVTDPSIIMNPTNPRFIASNQFQGIEHPPGPYGDFYKRHFLDITKPVTSSGLGLNPIEIFKKEMAKADKGPFMTDSAFIYETTATKRTTLDEDVSQFDKKIDDKSDSDYDEEDVKGLPMRRKRDISYLNSVLRIPNQLSKETEQNTHRAYKSRSNKENKMKPERNRPESITIMAIFRNYGTKSS